jgi:hypothetical protein
LVQELAAMLNETSKPVLWKPKAIERPMIERSFLKLPAIERSAEVLRHSLLKAEHWLSPNGCLREWCRLNILVALLIGMPALFVVPILTYLLGQFATWMLFLAQAARNLIIFIGYMLAVVAMISAAVMFVRSRTRKRHG